MTPLELNLWRAERQITQAALGKMLDVGRSTVQAYERGRLPIPRWYSLAVLRLGDEIDARTRAAES
jgi:DNA-binding XRE family transcriptional regulator